MWNEVLVNFFKKSFSSKRICVKTEACETKCWLIFLRSLLVVREFMLKQRLEKICCLVFLRSLLIIGEFALKIDMKKECWLIFEEVL